MTATLATGVAGGDCSDRKTMATPRAATANRQRDSKTSRARRPPRGINNARIVAGRYPHANIDARSLWRLDRTTRDYLWTSRAELECFADEALDGWPLGVGR